MSALCLHDSGLPRLCHSQRHLKESERAVRSPLSTGETERLVRSLSDAVANGKAVAIHCRAGIGRSSVIAACILVRHGYDVKSAFDTIARARGVAVPDTDAQRAWVTTFQAAQ